MQICAEAHIAQRMYKFRVQDFAATVVASRTGVPAAAVLLAAAVLPLFDRELHTILSCRQLVICGDMHMYSVVVLLLLLRGYLSLRCVRCVQRQLCVSFTLFLLYSELFPVWIQ